MRICTQHLTGIKGFTLVEILISVTLFAIIISGVLSIHAHLLKFHAFYQSQQEIDYSLEVVDEFLTDLLLVDGYLSTNTVVSGSDTQLFYNFNNDKRIQVESFVSPTATLPPGTSQTLFSSRVLYSEDNGMTFNPLHPTSVSMTLIIVPDPNFTQVLIDARSGKLIRPRTLNLSFRQLQL
jgi:prepilin-type N-terminal cleavage/methylation domain-containing protein